jgi:hypothetical protein
MGAFIDLAGRRFGRLVVQARSDKPHLGKARNVMWICQCDCGAKITRVSSNILIGHSEQSCGCHKKDFPKPPPKTAGKGLSPHLTCGQFWSLVDKSGGEDACWPWTESFNPQGYGTTRYHGAVMAASRAAFLWNGGILEAKMMVRHSCDNPPCCNPGHLLRGFAIDNVREAFERNLLPIGSKRVQAKLSEDIVRMIRLDGRTQRKIAASFGVHQSVISRIKNGRKWTHVG